MSVKQSTFVETVFEQTFQTLKAKVLQNIVKRRDELATRRAQAVTVAERAQEQHAALDGVQIPAEDQEDDDPGSAFGDNSPSPNIRVASCSQSTRNNDGAATYSSRTVSILAKRS